MSDLVEAWIFTDEEAPDFEGRNRIDLVAHFGTKIICTSEDKDGTKKYKVFSVETRLPKELLRLRMKQIAPNVKSQMCELASLLLY